MQDDSADAGALGLPSGYAIALLTLVGMTGALGIVFWPRQAQPVDVRFCNATPAALRQVESGGATFGDIAPQACSPWRTMARAYASPSFYAGIGAQRTYVGPEDHVGAEPLQRGRYEFVIESAPWGLQSHLQPQPTR